MALEGDAEPQGVLELPQPFRERPWRGARRAAAEALWDWHRSVLTANVADRWSAADADRVEAMRAVDWLPSAVSDAAFRTCRQYELDAALLAHQVRTAPTFWGPVRFEDATELDRQIEGMAGAHAQLLAALADAAHTWQVPYVREFARGLFLTGRLLNLPSDVAHDRVFVPRSDLEQAGVTIDQLRLGAAGEPMRRLLWKQVIRARDALAQSTPLAREISGRYSRAFRVWWMAGLEALNTIERRKFDLWGQPVRFSSLQRMQILLQAQFGRTTFRRR